MIDNVKKNKKITIIIIFIIFIIVLSFLIITYKINELPSVILQNNLSVEQNEKVKISSFIKSIEKGKIISKDDYIDTSTPGKQKITITIENNYNKKRDYTFYIEVVNN